MRVACGFAFMGIVAAEMIAAQSGIGYLIMQSRMLLRTDIMFVGLVTLGVLGAVIDGVFKLAIDRTMRRYMEYQVNIQNDESLNSCERKQLGGNTMYKTWTFHRAGVRHLVSAVVVATITLAGTMANAADPKIRIFSGTDEHWVPLQVAKTKGYFAAQGLDAEVTVFTTGAAATEAFRAGRGDFISAGDLPSAAMWKSGNVIGLAPMSSDTEIFGIVGKK